VGLISLLSFNTTNVFHNISSYYKNNIFKLKFTYIDTTSTLKNIQSITATFTIPNGCYEIADLLEYMNNNFFQDNSPGVTGPLSLGCTGTGTVGYTIEGGTYPYPTKTNIILQTFSSIYTQGNSIDANPFLYQSISVVSDSDTIEFLSLIGVFQDTNATNSGKDLVIQMTPYNIISDDGVTILGTAYNLYSNTFTTQSIDTDTQARFLCPYQYEIYKIRSLYISLENTISQNRVSFNGLTQTDVLYRIPINTRFYEPISFQATIEQFSYVTNLNLTSLTFNIFDQEGRFVNFRGGNWSLDIGVKFAINDDNGVEQASDLNLHLRKNSFLDTQSIINPLNKQQDLLFPNKRSRQNF
jgi:hypothetical protein